MDNPKISVLIPMYNRKHYIEDCINSALNQTFTDFEIIIRDNCSTDGSFEFVAEKFADQIADGKIRLIKNKRNVYLEGSSNRMMIDARGKYITFLHSDDMLMPYALQHLYGVAEATNADVVHESGFFTAPEDVSDKSKWQIFCTENKPVQELSLISDNPLIRFQDWFFFGTFHDVQYNLLRKDFMLENEIFFKYDYRFAALWWIMLAKVFVKTPVICYIRRDAPDAGSKTLKLNKIADMISMFIKMSRETDELFSKVELFQNDETIQYMVKARLLDTMLGFFVNHAGYYKNGISPELLHEVTQVFKQNFGDNYFVPMYLFNWQCAIAANRNPDLVVIPPPAPAPDNT